MPDPNHAIPLHKQPFVPYVLPLALFGLFTYLGALLPADSGITYTAKTIIVAACLIYYWGAYKNELTLTFHWLAPVSGVLLFFIWIFSEGLYPQIGHSDFNPYDHAAGTSLYLLILVRMSGAVLVVPLMEELFWRSFAMRFLIRTDFKEIPLGTFTWYSFIVVSVAFAFAHHRWLPGIVAGLIYGGVLIHSKTLFAPILSHAVTNLLLGIYVLRTEQWSFW